MADIAMCAGRGCEVRQTCYRFRAVSDGEHQTFSTFDVSPISHAKDCTYFWSIEQAEGPLAESSD